MYLPHLHELNLYNDNKLLVFPIKDLTETNPVYIFMNKDNAYVEGTDGLKNLLKNEVENYVQIIQIFVYNNYALIDESIDYRIFID